ncbi:CDP-glucose 4,6-dehydratase [Mesobacillus subterraneus]|uniref:CDP-glucose 4,6-dehydratase n=1 Tax=Mesobacillus subterraneus TaxID=285983 RepID=UPI001CFD2443|nr:CDP-glucose 4,6-dehydratase [Mesobacillus subterraneus]
MSFWKGKRILITGHTGFKGSWLTLWMKYLGAEVTGYSLKPSSTINLFDKADIADGITSIEGDIRNGQQISDVIEKYQPEIIFHMAAQSLVRQSYDDPVGTFETNIMGTVNVLNAVQLSNKAKVVINVTSDKCYENKEWPWGYRENDPFGGLDPYSASKGCAEIITGAFRHSFYNLKGISLASVRAGNVIGGGDWAEDRIIPDIIRSCIEGEFPTLRNPNAIRPWQHVLDPLNGYITLAEALYRSGDIFAEGWNFGPKDENVMTVGELTKKVLHIWGKEPNWLDDQLQNPYEAQTLRLDCSKAKSRLGWTPLLSLDQTLEWTVNAYKQFYEGRNLKEIMMEQIIEFEEIRS